MRIVFIGTPEIAAYCLDKINKSKNEIVSVVTTTDKPAGRGRKMQMSAVKRYSLDNNLNILQPEKLKDKSFIADLKKLNADLFIVVAFRMLPKDIWTIPRFGTINLHTSLLPDYRGAAPINWAIINGESKTGITTFFINENIDTGKIILQKTIEISETETAGTLHDKMMQQGSNLLLKTIDLISNNNHIPVEQKKLLNNFMQLNAAPKIYKEDCKINWNREVKEVYNFIRGLNPYPAAWTYILKGNTKYSMKIYDVEIMNETTLKAEEIQISKNYFTIGCKSGALIINSMQFQGKKRMKSADFMRGFDLINCLIS